MQNPCLGLFFECPKEEDDDEDHDHDRRLKGHVEEMGGTCATCDEAVVLTCGSHP